MLYLIYDVQLPQSDEVKYLGLHLDRRLTWHKHIFTKRKELGLTLTKMYWLLRRKSKLSTTNKLLLYKTIDYIEERLTSDKPDISSDSASSLTQAHYLQPADSRGSPRYDRE
jgi:hypothetical protein